MKWYVLLFIICLYTAVNAQQNKAIKQVVLLADTVVLDSFLIVKGTVKISANGNWQIENTNYKINYYTSTLININIPKGTTLKISYTPVFIDFGKEYKNKSDSIILPEFIVTKNPFKLQNESAFNGSIFSEDGLQVTGSLMRGLSIGNNQNAIVNSNLNLQFAGKINNDINVLAAISDDNNPIQPEGNTQQLQDFDQVFIQFNKDQHTITVGDFLMTQPMPGYFMNYFKKSRGLQGSTQIKTTKNTSLAVSANVALSRGRFVRNVINGVEGNQGPYRLTGPNGELFIIIISGTEAVYLDGERLNRGEQNDYVIDYNSGEVTFTAKKIITAYSRIIVEFQYSDRNYARTLFNINNAFNFSKGNIYLNYYIEQDNKNQPFQQQLSDSNKVVLANAGNNLQNALILSETPQSFTNDKILYRKTDSLGFFIVYVYAPTQGNDSIFFDVRFSYLGANKGNYKQSASAANGRVFVWVEPINGIPQGDFEPVIQLIAPNQIQMLTVGSNYKINKNTTLQIEGVQSIFNRNLFSTKDKQNDNGYGLKVNFNNVQPILQSKFSLTSNVQYEWVDQNFRYIERYRNVEFDRIWNRQLTNNANTDTGFNEHILFYKTTLSNNKNLNLNYQLGMYNRNQSAYSGLQHVFNFNLNTLKNKVDLLAELLNTNYVTKNSAHKYAANFGKVIGNILIGVKGTQEESKFKADTLLANSFSYLTYGAYLRNTDSVNLKYFLIYNNRTDKTPLANSFKENTVANEINAGVTFLQKNLNRLNTDATYREFALKQNILPNVLPVEKTFLARLEYDYGFFSRMFTANSYVALGSGNELRRDFQYYKVPQGQGIYVWKDFNEDGVQQINEFVVASFADRAFADYIKIILPTTSIIKTQTNQVSQTLNFNAPGSWQNLHGLKKGISYFSNQFAVRIENKVNAGNTSFNIKNIFNNNAIDTALISHTSLFRNTLFFNRSHPVYGADISVQQNQTKNLLTNGFESRNRNEYILNVRWNISSAFTFNSALGYGNKKLFSEYFNSNNFNFTYNEFKPKLTYQYQANFRFTLNYSFFEAKNLPEFGNDLGNIQEGGAEARFSFTKIGVLTAKYSLFEVKFNGSASSPMAYEMLQGLNIGNNQLWNVNLQQRIGANLQININYDGRKAEGINTIHIGRMEARYLF